METVVQALAIFPGRAMDGMYEEDEIAFLV